MTISPVEVRELPAALALLFGYKPDACSSATARAFQMLVRGEWNTSDLLIAKSTDQIIGAIFAQVLPGAAAVVLPPRTIDNSREVEDALTTAALQHVASAKVVQAFLEEEERQAVEALKRAGFEHVTQVLEMNRSASSTSSAVVADHLRIVPFSEVISATFRQTLWLSHQDSLDCPEMHGHRTPDEVYEGYRDCAREIAGWWLAEKNAEPVGVLILSESVLTYVGVLPAHRGKKIGRALVDFACKNSPELSLVVDVRNAPAVQLYRSFGFEPLHTREVFLKLQKV